MNTNSIADNAEPSGAQTALREGPVVIVDDDPYDALLSQGVVDELQPKFDVQILTSGEDLISYLQGDGLYKDRAHYPMPGLVLLDLNMPQMSGFQVLEWLQAHPEFAQVPVVVLSGATGMVEQVTRAYGKGAHSFLPKPIQLSDIQSILNLLNIAV